MQPVITTAMRFLSSGAFKVYWISLDRELGSGFTCRPTSCEEMMNCMITLIQVTMFGLLSIHWLAFTDRGQGQVFDVEPFLIVVSQVIISCYQR